MTRSVLPGGCFQPASRPGFSRTAFGATKLEPTAYARWFETELGRLVWSDERRALLPLLGPLHARSVLEVGAGDGRFAVELVQSAARVVGVDASLAMLQLAARRVRAAGATLPLCAGPVEALPFRSESFERVVEVTVLCFVPDPAAAVAEMARVVRPGGRLVLAELAKWSLWAAKRRIRGVMGDPLWRRAQFWTRRDLQRLLREAGLCPVEWRSAVFYPPSYGVAKLLRPAERALAGRVAVGAAFIAVAGERPSAGAAEAALPRGG